MNIKTRLGIPFFDDVFGGVYRGWQTLCHGRAGSGKSIFGMHFINQALAEGDRALFLSENRVADTLKISAQFGMPFAAAMASGQLTLLEYGSFIHALDRIGLTVLMTLPKPVSKDALILKNHIEDLCSVSINLDIVAIACYRILSRRRRPRMEALVPDEAPQKVNQLITAPPRPPRVPLQPHNRKPSRRWPCLNPQKKTRSAPSGRSCRNQRTDGILVGRPIMCGSESE
jgi:hypothetical protein